MQATNCKQEPATTLHPCASASRFTGRHEGLLGQLAQQTSSALRAAGEAAALRQQVAGLPAAAQMPPGGLELVPVLQHLRRSFKDALGAQVHILGLCYVLAVLPVHLCDLKLRIV